MARIKFSGVVSEVKGKLNGTVFSRNRGGAYMRNNKSGQTTNSAKSSQVKNKFGSLASRWRSLTVDQQNEWNAAGINYPTVNKFGDTRTPSGYELFMRLNGTLELMGLPIQVLPSLPKTISPLGAVSYDYPDLFQIMPERGINLDAMQDNDELVYAHREANLTIPVEIGDKTLVLFFELTSQLLNAQRVCLMLPYFTGYMNDETQGVYIEKRLSKYYLIVNFTDNTNENVLGFEKNLIDFNPAEPHVLSIQTSSAVPEGINVYLDGEFIETAINTGTAPTPLRWTNQIRFGYDGMPRPVVPRNYLKIGGYYEYSEPADAISNRLLGNGYILNSLEYGCDFSTGDVGQIGNVYDLFGKNAFSIFGRNFSSVVFSAFTPKFVPAYVLTVQNEGTTDEYIEVYATHPQSTGVSGKTARWVRIGSYIWGTNTRFALANGLQDAFGFIRPNAEIQFYCRVVNTTNGQADQMKTTPPRKGNRFKAGSELTDRVN